MRLVHITDQQLEDMNDTTAAADAADEGVSVSGAWLNALICEVQAWRGRGCDDDVMFQPGLNIIVDIDDFEKPTA